jgi:hypothetical protein
VRRLLPSTCKAPICTFYTTNYNPSTCIYPICHACRYTGSICKCTARSIVPTIMLDHPVVLYIFLIYAHRTMVNDCLLVCASRILHFSCAMRCVHVTQQQMLICIGMDVCMAFLPVPMPWQYLMNMPYGCVAIHCNGFENLLRTHRQHLHVVSVVHKGIKGLSFFCPG